MDPLSDVVAAMRVGDPHAARVVHRAPFGVRFPPVDAAGFHVVLEGACWFYPAAGDPIALRPGDIVFLSGGHPHALADDPATPLGSAATSLRGVEPTAVNRTPGPLGGVVLLCGAYLLDRSRTHPMFADLPETIHLPAPTTRHTPTGTVVDLLDIELGREQPGRDAMLRALLDALLLNILRSWLDERADSAGAGGWAAALRDPAVAAALRAIHRRPGHGWTVAALADQVGLARATFARRFTTLVGRTPIAYLTWWRMTLAARQLRDTDEPLAAIARNIGYANGFAFAHAFKNEFGCPPGKFRKEHQESRGDQSKRWNSIEPSRE